ncbi:MAG TPA: response regulator transcription factor [Chitinophagaceae bacterium]|nr:response regulator transcription factor [Chitinophagaceae bacterium]
MKILIIEDEQELARSMVSYLQSEHYLCVTVGTYRSALEKIDYYDYDCIILDITLPDGSGLDILRDLRINRKADGVIIISAKNSTDDKIIGLQLGADDYLTKPFHLAELSARVAAVIRRKNFGGSDEVQLNDLHIHIPAMRVRVKDEPVDLTRREFELLLFLVANKNRVVSKSAIASHLSGDEAESFGHFDFVYAHIKNLKKKLAEAGSVDFIRSIYGVGYKLET